MRKQLEEELRIQRQKDREFFIFPEEVLFAEMMSKEPKHAGISNEDFGKLEDPSARDLCEYMPVEQIREEVIFNGITNERALPPHPFKRRMVKIDGSVCSMRRSS